MGQKFYSLPSLFNVELNWTHGGVVLLTTAANERAESNKTAKSLDFFLERPKN
jgi:hypothetical protein